MTITETRPGAVEPAAAAATAPPESGNWLTTGDHKRLGLLYLAGGLLAVVVGAVLGAAYLVTFGDDVPALWSALGSRLSSGAVAGIFVVGLPAAWLGLMTYVVPLQIGATRIGLPRLQSLSVWTFLAGGVVTALGYVIERGRDINLGAILPPPAVANQAANTSTELLLAGLMLVALATALGAVGLATTILNHRGEGVTLARMPAFAWSALATALVLTVSTPVFLAGLALLYADQHYGGAFFSPGAIAGLKTWQHHLWVFGRPEVFLVATPALGVFCDVVATAAGRPLLGFKAARGLAVFAVFWSLVAWATPFSGLTSPVTPTPNVGTALIVLPVAIVVLTWLGSFALGSPGITSGIFHAAGFVVVGAVATAMAVVAGVAGVEGELQSVAFANSQITLVAVGAGLLGVTGGIAHWAPKLSGRLVPAPAAALQTLLIVGGALLLAVPGWSTGLGADTDLSVVGALGAGALALAGLLSVPALAPGAGTDPDPSGRGLTLEWVAASPPPPHNFDVLPAVASAHPLSVAATDVALDDTNGASA